MVLKWKKAWIVNALLIFNTIFFGQKESGKTPMKLRNVQQILLILEMPLIRFIVEVTVRTHHDATSSTY